MSYNRLMDARLGQTMPELSLFCPACGYDQRGLPVGTPCPECGGDCTPAVVLGAVNRWAEGALLDLWSIGVFQSVGAICALLAVIGIRRDEPAAMLLFITAGLYMPASAIWFVIVFVGYLRRRVRPVLRNISVQRRRRIRDWLIGDALLIALPPMALWLL
ncbi:MAG: hypothetical protein IID37_09460 [Planctomycetes bacterium]|nr:hypothetical protein [Planctomycetota bacterium]